MRSSGRNEDWKLSTVAAALISLGMLFQVVMVRGRKEFW